MKFDLDPVAGNMVQSFSPGALRINGRVFASSVIVTANKVIEDWAPARGGALALADLEPVLALEPELILLGTGTRQEFPDGALMTAVQKRGIGLEVMDTAAACRTFNVLVSEHRRVAAVLMHSA